jgi:hypothetical protein
MGWRWSSSSILPYLGKVKHLPSMYKALGLIPSTAKQQNKNNKTFKESPIVEYSNN